MGAFFPFDLWLRGFPEIFCSNARKKPRNSPKNEVIFKT